MAETYYNVSYIEYEDGLIKNTDRMLICSSTPISIDQIKNFIRNKIGNPRAVITLSESTIIDKETFIIRR